MTRIILLERVIEVDWNPPEVPQHGAARVVYDELNTLYLMTGKVFSDSLSEWYKADQAGIRKPKGFIEKGFKVLEKAGLITIQGDTFTPTEVYLKKFKTARIH